MNCISDRRRDAITAIRKVADDTRITRRNLAEKYPSSGVQQAPYDLVMQSLDHTIALAEKMGLILTDEN